MKGQTRDNSEFVTKFVGNIVTIILVLKSLSNSLWNLYYTGFFIGHIKHKTEKKTTFRMPSANPC